MCSRFRSVKDPSLLAAMFNLSQGDMLNYMYNPNVAPTEEVPIITVDETGAQHMRMARFGIPNQKGLMLNTRTDSIAKGAKRSAYAKRRCIIPTEGFYEWREENGKKQPYMFALKDAPVLPLGGIWEDIEVKGEKVIGFSIITDEPNDVIAAYHDRMPLALGDTQTWLDLKNANPLATLSALPPEAFTITAKNPAMNSPREKNFDKIEAQPEAASGTSGLLL